MVTNFFSCGEHGQERAHFLLHHGGVIHRAGDLGLEALAEALPQPFDGHLER